MTKLDSLAAVRRSTIASVIMLAGIAACRHAAPPATPDVGVLASCYPYAEREGECLHACDPSLGVPYPESHPDCAQGEWPLLCNNQRECYPVEPHSR
ncbi:hypothetical protein ACNOYE_26630 [Nannocystaceae bacterium ST9]